MRHRYGSLPAIGHAEAFLHQQGVHDFTYVGKGETAHGPVHIFATDEGTQLHVGRLLGGDRLKTRTVRARANSKKKKSPKQRDMALLMHLERKGAGAGRHVNKPQRGSGKGSGKLGRHPKHKGGGQGRKNSAGGPRIEVVFPRTFSWSQDTTLEFPAMSYGGVSQRLYGLIDGPRTEHTKTWNYEYAAEQALKTIMGGTKEPKKVVYHWPDGTSLELKDWSSLSRERGERGDDGRRISSAFNGKTRKNGRARRNGDVSIEIPMSLTWARAAEAARDLTRAGYARKTELTLDQDQYGELCMLATLRDVAPGIDAWTLQQAFLGGRLASANR